MTNELTEMELAKIEIRSCLRKSLDDLDTLTESIKRLGLLHPVIVDPNGILIAGHRRFEACKLAGLTTVPVIKVPVSHDSIEALDIKIDENLCRKKPSEQDLEKHIKLKSAKAGGPSKVKKLFSRSG